MSQNQNTTPNLSAPLVRLGNDDPRPVSCGFCNKDLPSRSQFKVHLNTCTKRPKCRNCSSLFDSKAQLHTHLRYCKVPPPAASSLATQVIPTTESIGISSNSAPVVQ